MLQNCHVNSPTVKIKIIIKYIFKNSTIALKFEIQDADPLTI